MLFIFLHAAILIVYRSYSLLPSLSHCTFPPPLLPYILCFLPLFPAIFMIFLLTFCLTISLSKRKYWRMEGKGHESFFPITCPIFHHFL